MCRVKDKKGDNESECITRWNFNCERVLAPNGFLPWLDFRATMLTSSTTSVCVCVCVPSSPESEKKMKMAIMKKKMKGESTDACVRVTIFRLVTCFCCYFEFHLQSEKVSKQKTVQHCLSLWFLFIIRFVTSVFLNFWPQRRRRRDTCASNFL